MAHSAEARPPELHGFWKEFEEDQREIHIALFSPDALCRGIETLLRPLRFLVVLIPVLAAVAIATIANNFADYVVDAVRYRGPVSLAARMLFSFVTVNLLSELCRGVIAVHFGGQARLIGIRLVLGIIPRFHLAVDRIAGNSRREILWIFTAPLLTRLVLASFGTLLWWFTRSSGTGLPALAIMLSMVSTISLLINANPLARRNDGYHVLAALVDMPDLRRRATRTLLGLFRNRRMLADTDATRALLTYAIASLIYALLIVALYVIISAYWLEYTYHGTGVAVFLVLLAYLVWHLRVQARTQRAINEAQRAERRAQAMAERAAWRAQLNPPAREAAGGVAMEGAALTGGTVGPTTGGGSASGAVAASRSARARPASSSTIAGLLPVLAVVIVMLLPYQYKAGGPVSVLPLQQREIYAEMPGLIEEVRADSGQVLRRGEIIAVLSAAEEQRSVKTTLAEIAEQEALLEEMRSRPREEDVELARRELDTALVQLRFSEGEAARSKRLYESGVIPLEDYEDANRKREVDRAHVTEAQARLLRAGTGAHPNEIEAAEARLSRLREELAYHEEQFERTRLRMPFDGRVVSHNLRDREGAWLDQGDRFAVVENAGAVRVQLRIAQTETAEIRSGAVAEVKFWALPQQKFRGEVIDIATAVEDSSLQGEVLTVTTIIDNPDGALKSGMTGYGKVLGEKRTVFEAFVSAMKRFVLIEMWGWLP